MTGPNADDESVGSAGLQGGAGIRFAAVFSMAVVAVFAVVLVGLDRAGVASRTVRADVGERVVVVRDSRALLDTWDGAGVHGALLVDVTRDLAFATLHPDAIPTQVGWPVADVDPSAHYRAAAATSSMLWGAANSGIARSIVYVMTPADLAEIVEFGRQNGLRGISADGKSITANNEGYLRYVSSGFPAVPGPAAVLNVDASYFIAATPEQFFEGVGATVDTYEFITLNRCEDSTNVPDAARRRLDRVAEILDARVAR